jgi:AcrR family transcriptional regulator
MKATYEIIARRGLEGLVIQDITEAADVGYGTFYNHFTTKDAAVAAVIDASRDFTKEIYRRLGEHACDRAEAFVLELLACLRLSNADKTWGWFIVRTVLSGEERRSGIAVDLSRALDACVEAGVFRPGIEMAYEITSGLLLIGTLKLLRGDLPQDYPERLVQTILQHLGLPDPKISSILSKPFPDVQLPRFLEAA